MLNNNAISTNTNIEFGSSDLGEFWLQAQSCSLPGLTFALPEVDGRAGARLKLAADNVEYGDLIIDAIIDKEWKAYDIIYDKFIKSMRVDKGTFSNMQEFDMWLDIRTGKGAEVRKFWFYDVRLSDLAEFDFDVRDQGDENLTLTLSFRFNYMEYIGSTIAKEI